MDYLLIVVIIITLLVIGYIIGKTIFTAKVHNKLLRYKNKVENASAHIGVQLQRRMDLIPNLVEIVKGVSEHEQQITKNLSVLFEKYAYINSNAERFLVNEELSKLLNTLYKEIDMFPNIRANKNFLLLQKELAEIEEDISFARQFYNDAVTIYNNTISSFPNNLVAKKYNFEKEKLFNFTKSVNETPQIRIVPKRPEEIKCSNCGAILREDIRYCEYCGTTF